MHLDARTQLVTLLGHPIEHSLSPLLHNTAFREQGRNWVYVATPVAPPDLEAAVRGLKALQFRGANVTIPHKQGVRALMDTLSERARIVGAVNTIVCQRSEGDVMLHGDNTDVAGFLEPLERYADRLQGEAMLIFGSGGAARAVTYALLKSFRPSRLTLAARSPRKAERLAGDLAGLDDRKALAVAPLAEAGAAVRPARLLVNATPLGMHPHTKGSPWTQLEDFSEGQIAYDLVYNPEQTQFLQDASSRGVETIGGLHMLVSQAAASYRQWTGEPMPTGAVKAALRRHTSHE